MIESMRKILGLFVTECKHCEAMASHYSSAEKDDVKWHFWYGRKQVCDELIAAIRAEFAPPDVMNAKDRRKAFIKDVVEVCRKHRVLMDEPDDWDNLAFEDIAFSEQAKKGCGFTVDVGDLEREIREALWNELKL